MRKKIAAAAVAGALVSAVMSGTAPASGAPVATGAGAGAGSGAGASVRADFNNDGVADLAIGVPDEDSGVQDSGAVNVIYGSAANGLRSAGNQLWTQNSAGILDEADENDRFGYALAAGDFNGDGFSDLAVGVPFEAIGASNDPEGAQGAVQVIYGSATGLTAEGNQFWTQESPGVADEAEAFDRFGISLAAGNLGRSAHDDLAIGVVAEDVTGGDSTVMDAGAVNVIYGTAAGLAASEKDPVWTQETPGIAGDVEPFDQFGYSLAIGNFGLSDYDDLAVSAPGSSAGESSGVHVIYGAASGLSTFGSQFWRQDGPYSLAAGNLGRTTHDDLVIGAPYENRGTTQQGAVHVVYGSSDGLKAAGKQVWSQDSAGISGAGEDGDGFGYALAIGNFGKSAHQDLAIGVPYEDVAGTNDGGVSVIYGSAAGLSATGNQFWGQNSSGIVGAAESSDQFGETLTAANFGRSARDDLAVGVPSEDSAVPDSGAVNVIYGSASGLNSARNQLWSQDSAGISGAAEASDRFGSSSTAVRS